MSSILLAVADALAAELTAHSFSQPFTAARTYADAEYARKLKSGVSFREGEYLARRCEQTNRQLLKAIESLARVRRLLTPMQINIGQNQINVTQQARSGKAVNPATVNPRTQVIRFRQHPDGPR